MNECENCGESLPELSDSNFKQTDGGTSFSPDFGTYHWFEGELECDCGHVNFIQDQSI